MRHTSGSYQFADGVPWHRCIIGDYGQVGQVSRDERVNHTMRAAYAHEPANHDARAVLHLSGCLCWGENRFHEIAFMTVTSGQLRSGVLSRVRQAQYLARVVWRRDTAPQHCDKLLCLGNQLSVAFGQSSP